MQVTNIQVDRLRHAEWNPNYMDDRAISRLDRSIDRFGLVQNLVVRPVGRGEYEVLAGNQSLQVLRQTGALEVPCVVVELGDAEARLLCQALNRIHGADDLGLRAELVREVLEAMPEEVVLGLLPDTPLDLDGLTNLGRDSMDDYLKNWQAAQAIRLTHLQFQLTREQVEWVEEALEKLMPEARTSSGLSPNARGTALYLMCRKYIEMIGGLP